MVTINLTEAQVAILLAFLNRVDLKGQEAMALAQLQQIIQMAQAAPPSDGRMPAKEKAKEAKK